MNGPVVPAGTRGLFLTALVLAVFADHPALMFGVALAAGIVLLGAYLLFRYALACWDYWRFVRTGRWATQEVRVGGETILVRDAGFRVSPPSPPDA